MERHGIHLIFCQKMHALIKISACIVTRTVSTHKYSILIHDPTDYTTPFLTGWYSTINKPKTCNAIKAALILPAKLLEK